MRADIKSMRLPELRAFIEGLGMKGFHAKQIFSWLYKGVTQFSQMTDLSARDRALLEENAFLSAPEILQKQVSKLDGTVKYLFGLTDGQAVESVLMQYEHGVSLCISTQAGCRMGCAFCASTIGGLQRNLTAGEIADQVIFAQRDSGKRISHLVLMGIGEPLDNFDNVVNFLYNINDPNGLGIGMRNISLSTCGLVERIYELAKLNLQLTLSISLHAPSDELRSRLMPVNRKYPIDELLKACYDYFDLTGRRISFEYTLVEGFNDTAECARQLSELLKKMPSHVNLIEVNNVRERGFTSSRESTKRFQETLRRLGVNATVRRKLGGDIDASCGQLRAKQIQNQSAKSAGCAESGAADSKGGRSS